MHFGRLQAGLLAALKERLRNGDLTERRIARLTGISQPHIHNVLKGVRILSPEIADRILDRFPIPLVELLPPEETVPGCLADCEARRKTHEVPVLEGRLGPGMPLPRITSRVERYPFPSSALASLSNPVVARLGPDIRMKVTLAENDLVLLDHGWKARLEIRDEALYVLNRRGEGLVRRLRLRGELLYVVSEDALEQPSRWEGLSLSVEHILDNVRARVVWVGRNLRND